MMKKLVFCIAALFVCMGIFAQQQPVVAVAPFDAISGITETDANMITRVFFIRLGNTNKVSLVDRNVVDRVLREHSFQAGDWSDQQKTAELGKALNTDWIVRGEMEKFGENILVTIQFYDIQTFRFMGGADTMLKDAADALEKMDPLVNRLIETIAGNPSQPRQAAQQGGNADASAYYGTWVQRIFDGYLTDGTPLYSTTTLTITANRINYEWSLVGAANRFHIILSNCTWTAVNNSDTKVLTDYPKGFKVFGTVTDLDGANPQTFMPIYLFIHKSDNNRLTFYNSPASNSEVQESTPRNSQHFGKVN